MEFFTPRVVNSVLKNLTLVIELLLASVSWIVEWE